MPKSGSFRLLTFGCMDTIDMTTKRIPVLLLVFLAGCEVETPKGDQLPTIPVTGSIQFMGKSLPGARVVFHPAEPREGIPRPTGTTDANGTFTIRTYREGDGAPAGLYFVTISCKGPYEGKEEDRDEVAPELLPFRYLQAQSSGITANVFGDAVQLAPWNLTAGR